MSSKRHLLGAVETDMTPMIDVVFQLIIFFLTTISFKALEGKLETQLPKDTGGRLATDPVNLLRAEIELFADAGKSDGFSIALNGSRIPSLTTLRARLTELMRLSPEMKASLHPGVGINYSHVVKVVDECLKAGMLDINFAGVAFDA